MWTDELHSHCRISKKNPKTPKTKTPHAQRICRKLKDYQSHIKLCFFSTYMWDKLCIKKNTEDISSGCNYM